MVELNGFYLFTAHKVNLGLQLIHKTPQIELRLHNSYIIKS